MAVRGVLAEADVGDHGQVGVGVLQRPDRHLHDPLVVVGAAADLVLGGGDAEQQQRADPGGGDLAGLLDQVGDREALDARHRLDLLADPLAGDDEGGLDQVGRRELGLADHAAQRRRSAAGGACGCRERASTASLGKVGCQSLRGLERVRSRCRHGGWSSATGSARRCGGSSFDAAARGAGGDHRAQRGRQDDAALDPRRDPRARRRRGAGRARRGRLGAAAGGALPAADRRGEPAAVRAAGGARGPARLGRGDARAVRARRAPRRDRRPPLRRQPAADQHRDRAALAAGGAAARRAQRRPRPAPAGAPLGVRRRPRRARHDGDLLHPRHPGGRALRRPAAGPRRRRGALRRLARRRCARQSAARRPEAADRDFETAFVAYLHHRGH